MTTSELDGSAASEGGDATILIGGGDNGPDPSESALARGSVLGRYMVLDRLGAGGMGIVVRAYDPKLHREVALKVLRGGRPGTDHARIVREAQALARLNHPNVVGVYDVDTNGGVVYVAMEYVAGCTLRAWLDERVHAWPEVVGAMRQAAAGLAGAHEAGLVHRDFKPGNVMLGDDGRVRVMDFGLARGGDEPITIHGAPDDLLAEASGSFAEALTQHGTVIGTPAYMAPEQHVGQGVDARCDQYAFGIVLFEALYGRHPFPARDLATIVATKHRGLERLPSSPNVPPWLQAVVLRALAVEPADRFAGMREIEEALGRDRRSVRRRAVAIGVLGIGGASAAALWVARPDGRCEVDPSAEVWNAERSAAIVAGFAETGLGYADDAARRVTAALDGYADTWRAAWSADCRGGSVPGAEHALRSACLERARIEWAALVHTLGEGVDPSTVQRAAASVAALPRVARCDDVGRPVRAVDDAGTSELRDELAAIKALTRAGRFSDADASLSTVRERADTLGDDALAAEIALADASLADQTAELERAEIRAFDAYTLAIAAGQDAVAARAAESSIMIVGVHLARYADGDRWARISEALVRRLGDEEAEIGHSRAIGALRLAEGDSPAALAAYEAALVGCERIYGADHLETAGVLNDIGNALDTLGRTADAKASYERSFAILEAQLGPRHPHVSRPLSNLGNIAMTAGDFTGALASYERATAIVQGAYGENHPVVAMSRYNIAGALTELGRTEEARTQLELAVASLRASLGPDHVQVAYPLTTLGENLAIAGEYAAARERLEEALTIRERHSEAPPLLAETRMLLADVLWHDPSQRGRAAELVRAARSDCEGEPDTTCKETIVLVGRWLAGRLPGG